MNALSRIIDLEAGKLLNAAEGPAPLSPDQLSALESLCKCAKALRTDGEGPPSDLGDTEEQLALVDTTR